MKRDVAGILPPITRENGALEALPAVQKLSRMRAWMEHRLWRRVRVRIPVAVAVGEAKRIAVVSDISAKGLRLSGVGGLTVGDEVTVSMRGFSPLAGSIVWSKGTQAGVALKQNLLG